MVAKITSTILSVNRLAKLTTIGLITNLMTTKNIIIAGLTIDSIPTISQVQLQYLTAIVT